MANLVHNILERAVAEPFRALLPGLVLGSADLFNRVLGSLLLTGRRSALDRRALDDRGRLGLGAGLGAGLGVVLVLEGVC